MRVNARKKRNTGAKRLSPTECGRFSSDVFLNLMQLKGCSHSLSIHYWAYPWRGSDVELTLWVRARMRICHLK